MSYRIVSDPDYWGSDGSEDGFAVEPPSRWSKYFSVSLPHQCDAWSITLEPDKDEAVAEMTEFVEAAQRALNRLINL